MKKSNQKKFISQTAAFCLMLLFSQLSLFKAAEANEAIKNGEKIFKVKGCKGCHQIGGDPAKALRAPDLKDVTKRRDMTWLKDWIKDPRVKIEAKDPIVMEMMKTFPTKMPYLRLSDKEIEDVIEYIKSKSAEGK